MNPGEKSTALSDPLTFATLLDETCDRLWDRQVQYSIRRLRKMERDLADLERELDALVLLGDRDRTG
jgi:transposase